MMMVRKLALAAALGVAGIGAGFAPTVSARVVVGIGLPLFAPPAPIVERIGIRPGYVWIPGYWRWGGVRYVWVGGYWTPPRHGYRWVAPRWVGCGPHWCYHRGYWHR
ncbi:MAG: YXWGXW repeat-containing protein [Rudaea sp.]